MTLQNKSWLKNESCRQYLSGESQENIANALKISVGTVNNLLSEIFRSDDTIELQRQIAIVAKRNHVDINQLAANLRFKNKIKQSGLDDRKIEKFLDGLDVLFNKYSIPPSIAANQLFSLIEMMQRENIEPHRLEEAIKSRIIELETINAQIEIREKDLEETKNRVKKDQERLGIKEKDLDQFHHVSQLLELYELPEFSTEYGDVARAIKAFKEMGYDPKVIVAAYNKSESLKKENKRAEARLQESEKMLESYRKKLDEEKARWGDYYNDFEMFRRLVRDGLTSEVIFRAVHVLENDFTKSDIDQIIEDMRTYGNVAAARRKLQRQYETEAESDSSLT
jgi:hypothetical protein